MTRWDISSGSSWLLRPGDSADSRRLCTTEKTIAYLNAIRFSGRPRTADTGGSQKDQRVEHRGRSRGLEAMKAMLEVSAVARVSLSRESRGMSGFSPISSFAEGSARRYSAGRVRSAREAKAQAVRRGVALSRPPDWRGRSGDGGPDRRRRGPPPARERGNSSYIGIRIGAPTTASCFRRKSEAATSVRTWSAATAC